VARLQLKRERLAELEPAELAAVVGGLQQQTALSCGIVACTYTRDVQCVAEKLSLSCPSQTYCPPPPA
jgi:hypothetical protein